MCKLPEVGSLFVVDLTVTVSSFSVSTISHIGVKKPKSKFSRLTENTTGRDNFKLNGSVCFTKCQMISTSYLAR